MVKEEQVGLSFIFGFQYMAQGSVDCDYAKQWLLMSSMLYA